MRVQDLKIALIGPLPPPSGGMANQTQQLAGLLAQEGVSVELVQVNPPYLPRWVGHIKGLRAVFRLLPYLSVYGAQRAAPICFTSWPTRVGLGIYSLRRRYGSQSCADVRW